MMTGLWQLTWLEIKIFLREPLGAIGAILAPVAVFLVIGRTVGSRMPAAPSGPGTMMTTGIPVLVSLLIGINAVLSLVTVISIYREGGILRRLRATPLRPHTILTAHVLVKLVLAVTTLLAMLLAGRRYYPANVDAPLAGFAVALLIVTLSILSVGFVIASAVPTARFAQPVGAVIFYPMIALSGLFFPIDALPPGMQMLARVLPLSYAVSLLRGIWMGEPWSAHLLDLGALAAVFVICTVISARVFRWE
ncbi:MAG TPA: ABC transporter permease [Vicinamibacterales bacterium]